MIEHNPACSCGQLQLVARRTRSAFGFQPRFLHSGALPLAEPPSLACAVGESLAAQLRGHEPPVVGIVRDGRLLIDCRTLTDAEADAVVAAVRATR